jgi:phasin family protein
MASKTAKTTVAGAETIETAMKNGADAMKNGLEKAAKGYDELVTIAKDNAEAWSSAANVAGKGFETINSEWFAFSRQVLEEGIAATRAMFETKSAKDLFELQSDFARKAVDAYVAEITKIGDIAVSTAKDAAAPLQARVTAFVDYAQARA